MAKAAAEQPVVTTVPDWRQVVGQTAELARWRAVARSGRLPFVILIHGRAGLGKRGLAAGVVAGLRCEAAGDVACGDCAPCRELRAGRDQDVLWLAGRDEKLGVTAADAVQEHLSVAPAPGSPRRVVVISDCEQLSRDAANRLLKTLEEPPPRALIIMTTSRVDRLLPTVLSRCIKWRVKPPPAALTHDLVAARLKALGQTPNDAAIRALIERTGLSPGAALQSIDRAADGTDQTQSFIELLSGGHAVRTLALAESLAKQSGLTMAELLGEVEMALNATYRQLQGSAGQPAVAMANVGPIAMRRRRKLLAELKRLVLTGMVPVNAQMGLEAIGLSAARQ